VGYGSKRYSCGRGGPRRGPNRIGVLDRFAVWTTSGTTGQPGLFVHDAGALAVRQAVVTRLYASVLSPRPGVAETSRSATRSRRWSRSGTALLSHCWLVIRAFWTCSLEQRDGRLRIAPALSPPGVNMSLRGAGTEFSLRSMHQYDLVDFATGVHRTSRHSRHGRREPKPWATPPTTRR
jgi:hypothetical protein